MSGGVADRRAGTGGPRHVWIDGRIEPADATVLTAFDRGFQLGDGVFETLRARAGRPTELAAHADRMARSAAGLAIPLPADLAHRLGAAIRELLAAEGLAGPTGDASIRITVSRGPFFGRGLLPPDEHPAPTIVVQAWPVPPTPRAHLEAGLHLVASSVRRDPENPLNALKTTSRADYVYARVEARSAGADDALFLTIDGYLSEATSANLFIVRGGDGVPELATPSLACAILPGTTRDWILRWAAGAGLTTTEGLLTTRDLAEADEAFLSSSVAGILPVTRYEGQPIGSGLPGPWTLRARADREAFIRGDGIGR
ncbi:MAG TPA: aminotransferase class IV [Candidatus Limnocylindrales bacterium]|nr:aminotransferase class IV [Candidatus Limnocylindrales bacterium]